MLDSAGKAGKCVYGLAGLGLLAGLYVLAQANYLLFHSGVELFSIVVAAAMFLVAWNTRQHLQNGYLLFLGIAYLFVGGIDLIHTLAYKGMGVFPGFDSDLPTQLWIAARYVEAASLVIAPAFLRRRLRPSIAFAGYAAVFAGILVTLFVWPIFPACFVEGSGLTTFKIASEYAISALLVVAVAMLFRNRKLFDRRILTLLIASLGLTIGSEILFTTFISLYGISNLFGHLFKLASFYLIYRAIVETGLQQPFALVFRQLDRSRDELRQANDALEERVAQRTVELREANVHLLREVEERRAAEAQLRRLNFVLLAIRNVNQLIVRERDRERILEEVCEALVEGSGYSTAWIALGDTAEPVRTSAWMSAAGTTPDFAPLLQEGKLPPCGERAWTDGGVVHLDFEKPPCSECPANEPICNLGRMAARLDYNGLSYGVLCVTSPGDVVTPDEETDLLDEVAGDIAFALHGMDLEDEKRQATGALRRSLNGTIEAIAATAESRDPYTAGHQRRVTELAVAIGRELGLEQDSLDALRVAGLLHDIGKISIPAEILSKPTRLTDAELELVRGHPQMAYDILKSIDFPWPISEFVLQHHERLDGTGYPAQLSGDQIRLEARIIAVADVVEAMSSHRPYRAAVGIDAALEEIRGNAGRFYDERVVASCLHLFEEKEFRFSEAT